MLHKTTLNRFNHKKVNHRFLIYFVSCVNKGALMMHVMNKKQIVSFGLSRRLMKGQLFENCLREIPILAKSVPLFWFFIFGVSIFLRPACAQAQEGQNLRFVFYNAENFFDPQPDQVLHYDEFTPQGSRHWTTARYRLKIQHLFKTLIAVGEGEAPALVGFAEIENRHVLDDLIHQSPLAQIQYNIIHFDSPDPRGIDVGCIYRPERLTVDFAQAIKVGIGHPGFRTRDILYLKIHIKTDTLHLFINHWPSRYGGLMETIEKRKRAANVLIHFIDSITLKQPGAMTLVMGDFNENQNDEAVQSLLQSGNKVRLIPLKPQSRYGLSDGSIKGGGQWALFDQIFVSKSLMKNSGEMRVNGKSFYIFDASFLLEKDGKNMGLKPNRTFVGFKYHGGFSDHLPIFVDLMVTKTAEP